MSYYHSGADILRDLKTLDSCLGSAGTLYLEIVGNSALLLAGYECCETEDIDTTAAVPADVKEIAASCSIDINDDAAEYAYKFEDGELLEAEGSFSNIVVLYYDAGTVISSKLDYDDDRRVEQLKEILEEEIGCEMSVDGIAKCLEDLDVEADRDRIEGFLENAESL